MADYTSKITFETSQWDVDLEFKLYSDTANQRDKAVFYPFWSFYSKVNNPSSRTFTCYIFNRTVKDNNNKLSSYCKSGRATSSGSGIDWGSRSLQSQSSGKAFTTGEDTYQLIIVSSEDEENIEDIPFDIDPSLGLTITKCLYNISFSIKLYWVSDTANVTRPEHWNTPLRGIVGGPNIYAPTQLIEDYTGNERIIYATSNTTTIPQTGDKLYDANGNRVYDERYASTVEPVAGTHKNIAPGPGSGYPYGHGLPYFVDNDIFEVDNEVNGIIQIGPYQFASMSDQSHQFVGWAFKSGANTYLGYNTPYNCDGHDSYIYDYQGYSVSGFKCLDSDYKPQTNTLNEKNIWVVAIQKTLNDQVKITFKKNTSATVENMPDPDVIQGNVSSGGLRLPSNIPTRDNYDFIGWSRNKNDKIPTIPKNKISTYRYNRREDLILYAIWGKSHNITYYMNDGTSTIYRTDPKEYGKNYKIKSGPSREGYRFIGWNTKSNGSGDSYSAGDWYEEDENLILYAQWQQTYKKIWIYTGDGAGQGWKQGRPWIYNGTEWKPGNSAWVYNGSDWKEER